ncbi:MAG: hypothetical protein ACXVCE_15220 [Bacteriovorax sp.]
MSKVKKTLKVGTKNYSYYSLKEAKNLAIGNRSSPKITQGFTGKFASP